MGDDKLTGRERADKLQGCVNLSVHTNLRESMYVHSGLGGGFFFQIIYLLNCELELNNRSAEMKIKKKHFVSCTDQF